MNNIEMHAMIKGVFGDESKGVQPKDLPDFETPLLKVWYRAFPSWRDALEDPESNNVHPPGKLLDQVIKFLASNDKKKYADHLGDADADWSFDYVMGVWSVSFLSFPPAADEDTYYNVTIELLPNGELDPDKIIIEEFTD
jgi:hypothetical protein